MFNINGKKEYKVVYSRGGQGQNGAYTLITVEDEVAEGRKYPDRLKINIWGEDISDKVPQGAIISIMSAVSVGLVITKDKTQEGKFYNNLTITCNADDIVVDERLGAKPKATQKFEPVDNTDDLPF